MNLKVKSSTSSLSLAGSIAKCIRNHKDCELSCIGASAVNQAIKAVAIANEYLKEDKYHLSCIPTFQDVVINGENRSLINLKLTVSDVE